MAAKVLLQAEVLWSLDSEISSSKGINLLNSMLSSSNPIHHHEGQIILTETILYIQGDYNLTISLNEITEIYLGFDNVITPMKFKNFGLFWQPLRVRYDTSSTSQSIYTIIGYDGITCENQNWYNALIDLLS